MVRSIIYYVYGFSPRTSPSGMTTYVDVMRHAANARGVRARVLCEHADADDPDAIRLAHPRTLRRAIHAVDRVAGGAAKAIAFRATIALAATLLERRGHADVIEIEEHAGIGSLLVRAPLASPVVVRLHGPHFLVARSYGKPWSASDDATDRAELDTIRRAYAITAPSRDVLARTRAHFGLELRDAVVIPNATPIVNEDERWQPGGTSILFVGRFDRTKGADLVVEAFRRIAPDFPRAELLLVGPDSGIVDDHGTVAHADEYLARELPDRAIASRVRFLDAQPPSTLASLRKRCAVVVVASRYETFCLAAAEAMMTGCPVVTSDAGALPEVVDDGLTGLRFRSGDAEDLARVLRTALSTPDLAACLGSAARREASSRFAPDTVAVRMLEFYGEIEARKRRARGAHAGVVAGRSR